MRSPSVPQSLIIIHQDAAENEVTRMYTLPARDSSTPPTLRRRQEINEDLAGSLGHCAETLHENSAGRAALSAERRVQ